MPLLLLVVLAAAGVIVLLLALIGGLYLTRGTPVRRVRTPGDSTGLPDPQSPAFRATMELLTHAELRPGHGIEVFGCGDELYPRLWEDLRNAQRSITLQLYYCQPGRMADEFADIVLERAAAGVRVLFLRDAFGSGPLPAEYMQRLSDGGVHVAIFRPTRAWELHKVQHRSHIRVVAIDGTVGYTGGFGLDDKWFGDGRSEGHWRDTTTRFVGPAVLQLQATFAAGWAEATGSLLAGEEFFPLDACGEPLEARRAGEDAWAGVVHCAPTLGSTQAERYMALAIAGARRRLWITNAYFVPDDAFCRMLCDAVQRGVDVRILTPGRHTDMRVTYWAGRARWDRLLAGGVRLYSYEPSMVHAKTVVVDGHWCSIGTMNFDNRSMAFNDETLLLVHDTEVAERLEALFEADLRFSREVTREGFGARPAPERLREQAATLVSRFL